MKKKTAIITFHCVPNYGAVLQAYALQTKLKEMSSKAGIVDYRPSRLTAEYKDISFYSIFSVAGSLWSLNSFRKKKKKFAQFENEYLDLIPCDERNGTVILKDATPDIVFLGSDQIWNPDITHGFDRVYFGDIIVNAPFRAASYAASIGKKNFTEEEKTGFAELIQKVEDVSVREKEAQIMIEQEFGKKVKVVVDPTILAGKMCFESLAKPVPYKKYLLFYSLTGMKESAAMADKVARYCGYELVELSGRRKPYIVPQHTTIYDAGPIDFVSLFYNAEYIVTDSFHGTVFSLLFHKKFISLANKKRGGRITGLLEAVGLIHHCTDRFDREIVLEEIAWDEVDRKIEEMRADSIDYIMRVMGE